MLDDRAIEAAYRTHGHSVRRRATRILGNAEEAQEVLQEVFTSLLARPAQFAGDSSLLTWLYSATTHRALNRLRDQRNRGRILEANAERTRPLGAGASSEDQTAVRELLRRAPDELAQVAIYYYFDQLTHAEISTLMSCSRRQVGNLLERFHALARGEP